MADQTTLDQIHSYITENDIVLYMKGTAEAPQCGFSGIVAQILTRLEVPFKTVNVLTDPNIREGIKKFSNWPTIPQLYIKGEFIGGCDIVKEMYQNGELQALLKSKEILAP
jgi:monothiol glutaredoxin